MQTLPCGISKHLPGMITEVNTVQKQLFVSFIHTENDDTMPGWDIFVCCAPLFLSAVFYGPIPLGPRWSSRMTV